MPTAAPTPKISLQRERLRELGVPEKRIYLDHGLTGTTRARPGLDQALATARAGNTLIVAKLDRLAQSVPNAPAGSDDLAARRIKLSPGGQVYDPADPMGKMFFAILAVFAEFEVDPLRMKTRESMAIARATSKLRSRQPELSAHRDVTLSLNRHAPLTSAGRRRPGQAMAPGSPRAQPRQEPHS